MVQDSPLVDPVALQFALWPHPPVTVRCVQDRNHRRRDVPLSTVPLSWICLMRSQGDLTDQPWGLGETRRFSSINSCFALLC